MLKAFGCCYREKVGEDLKAIEYSTNSTKKKESLATLKKNGSTDIDYDFLAPSVHHLQTALLEYMREEGFDEDATVYDIENLSSKKPGIIRKKGMNSICPIDGKKGAAYVQCLDGDDDVGLATHMLSYTWGYKIGDIVQTLVAFCKVKELDPKRTYVWICSLCNNQHRVVDKGSVSFEDFHSIFNKRVRGIGQIIAMMAPWNNPAYLKRVWCVFEMFEAYSDSACTVEIAMPPKEKESLIKAITAQNSQDGKKGIDELFKTLAQTKVESSNASRKADKVNILRLVEEGPGCNKLNLEVNHLMRVWVRETVMEAVKESEASLLDVNGKEKAGKRREIAVFIAYVASYISASGDHTEALRLHQKALDLYENAPDDIYEEELARTYNNLGTEFESLGRYEAGLEQHLKCLAIFEEIFGTEHENTSTSYFNVGAVKRQLGDLEGALEMYQKSIAIDEKVKGKNHIDTALGYSYVGRIYMQKEDFDGALEMFEKSLRIRKFCRGDNHPDVAIGLGDVGLIYHMKKDYDKAIENHKRGLDISASLLGNNHPDTGSCYQNLGGAFYEQGNLDAALEMCKKAKEAYVASFGSDHPKSEQAQGWLDIVEGAIKDKITMG
jgi:tetratricopeptide (TPR) repeat protein